MNRSASIAPNKVNKDNEIQVLMNINKRAKKKSNYPKLEFGDNVRPIFLAKSVRDAGYTKLVKEAHISFHVIQGQNTVKGIGYNMPQHIDLIKSGKPFDLVFQLQLNEWQGTQTVQMQVIDIKASA